MCDANCECRVCCEADRVLLAELLPSWDVVETSVVDAELVDVYEPDVIEVPSLEALRSLLMEWQRYALTLAEADVTALPSRLMDRTTAALDATCV